MNRVDLDKPPEYLTCMVYGDSRAGKTHFLATWPKVRILADARERGWETIRTMNKDYFYEGVRPEVIAINTVKDMVDAIKESGDELKKDPKKFLTLGIDSITFYADAYFDTILSGQAKEDTRGAYGALLSHVRRLMIKTHEFPCNVVWTALANDGVEGKGGVMLAGKSGLKLPAACQYWFYMRKYRDGLDEKRVLHTKNYGPNPCGGRDGGRLPDPLPEPTYKSFINCLMTEQPQTNGVNK